MDLATQRLSRIVARLVTIIFLSSVLACNAQDTPKSLAFKDGFGSRKGDSRMYVLTGCCWIRGISFGDPDQFVTKWLAQHPLATMTPVSKRLMDAEEWVYVWIEDHRSSLNVDLVRAGIFPGGAMADMVDDERFRTEVLKNPKLAEARALTEKALAANPQIRPERLESEDEYNRHMDKIKTAEIEARRQKQGIWSDSMKEKREDAGYP